MKNLFIKNEKLQEEAYNTLLELCKNNGNKLKISFSTCNLKGLYIEDNSPFVECFSICGGNSKDVPVNKYQSLEILDILQDAVIE